MLQGKWTPWRETFAIDLRSLALFRICMAVMLIYDAASRLPLIDSFYTDTSALPRGALIEKFINQWHISLHLASGQHYFIAALFALQIVLAIFLLVGYHTRVVSVLLWFLVQSYQVRNTVILSGADTILRVMLFWSMFVPLGAYASVDRSRDPDARKNIKPLFMSLGSLALMFQLCYMYWFTFILKSHPVWIRDYSAIYYALHADHFVTGFGQWMLEAVPYWWLQRLTQVTIWFELIGPILCFVPLFFNFFRIIIPIAFIGFHLGLVATLEIGSFPVICMIAWLIFFPPYFWDTLLPALSMKSWLAPLWQRLKGWWCAIHETYLLPLYVNLSNKTMVEQPSFVNDLLVAFFFILVSWWNYGTVTKKYYVPPPLKYVAQTFRVTQYWSMFAPYPMRDDGWFVAPGKLENGREILILGPGMAESWEKPKRASALYPNRQWRKYMRNIWKKKFKEHRLYFGKYVCRKWNREAKYNQRLETFSLYYMKETTPPPGEVLPEPEKVRIWTHKCFESSRENKS